MVEILLILILIGGYFLYKKVTVGLNLIANFEKHYFFFDSDYVNKTFIWYQIAEKVYQTKNDELVNMEKDASEDEKERLKNNFRVASEELKSSQELYNFVRSRNLSFLNGKQSFEEIKKEYSEIMDKQFNKALK
jgi:hypothetical protein